MNLRRLMHVRGALCVVVLALLLSMFATAAPALANSPWWTLNTTSAPTNLPPGGEGQIFMTAVNAGDATATGAVHPIVFTYTLPPGLELIKSIKAVVAVAGPSQTGEHHEPHPLKCTIALPKITCPYTGELPPSESVRVKISVNVTEPTGTVKSLPNTFEIEGGEVARATQTRSLQISGEPTKFGIEQYELKPENADGSPDLQAGSHPFQMTTTLNFNKTLEFEQFWSGPLEAASLPALAKTLHFVLPPGLVGNATTLPQCSGTDFSTLAPGSVNSCPGNTAIGIATVTINEPTILGVFTAPVPVFNLTPAPGEPARFGFAIHDVPVVLTTKVRTGSDYAVEATVNYATQAVQLLSSQVTFWGVPGLAAHDNERGWECLGGGWWIEGVEGSKPCVPLGATNPAPFLTMPTSCAEAPSSTVTGESWKGELLSGEYRFPAAFNGCNLLGFTPSISVEPDTHEASAPSGMTVKVHIPQTSTLSANGLAEADAKSTTLVLPEGITASAGAANGLLTCSAAGVGFLNSGLEESAQLENTHFDAGPVSCPDAAKIGSVNIKTPLIEHELTGYVYLASQDTAPFNSPLVLYIIAEDPVSGVRVKLAGEVQINPGNGQLTSVFRNTPPVPYEDLTLHLYGGPRASQATPAHCGTYTAAASFGVYSKAEPVSTSAQFAITSGPGGSPCPAPGALPFGPSFSAGSLNNQAGAFSPFSLTINRPDGNQALQSITMHLPPGAAAILASVTPCAEAQVLADACGPASLVGHSTAYSGLGSSPVALGGDVYLTGPYKGAPFGLLAVTHAKAGPFDLGDVLVRSAISVDPYTAAATITSDPLPQFVKGVPSQIKALNVTVDRPGFEFNPTNCTPMSITGSLSGWEGALNGVESPFGVANCAKLPFEPKLTVSASHTFSKSNGVSFIVRVTSTHGQANLARTKLVIPKTLPSRLTTIQKACPDSVFNSTPTLGTACEEGSNIGRAIVHTPVLKAPLEGPAYLVSHGGAAFPDVEFVLKGENGIMLILDGQTDIKNGVTTSTFNSVPDAPVESFEAILPAGPHSALTVYAPGKTSLCGVALTAPTTMNGQNGKLIEHNTPVEIEGCGGVKSFKESSAQKLAKALKACRKKKNKSQRLACERKARKLYAAKASHKAKKKKK